METIVSIRPFIAILASAVVVALIIMSRNRPNLRESWTYLAALVKFALVVSMFPDIFSGKIIEYTLFTVLPGIELKFRVDALGLFFATTASFLWIIATTYSIGYMRSLNEHAQTRYYACFAIALSSALGVAFSANLFTLYLFYEVLSIMTYPLVAHHEDDEAWEGSKKYIVYLMGASKTFLLGALILTYMITGTLDFQQGGIFNTGMSQTLVTITYVCFLLGFAKAGIMPLHNWLPSAMVAPTPVSGLLHAVAVVKVGVFSVVRVMLHTFGIDVMSAFNLGMPTVYFVSITILAASVIALTKDDLKARLAYSTVSQLSYVILGVALLTPHGISGGILHIGNHAFSKITLFFCAGSIFVASHIKKISNLSGIGYKMPLTMAAFTIGALSMIGVPAMAGFTSKWYMGIGAMEAMDTVPLIVLLASTVLNAAYFLPIVFKAYFESPEGNVHLEGVKEAPKFVLVPLLVTAVITVAIGVYPDFLLSLAERVLQ
ncbi:MAG: monovalent cation/H+ antiporter subunit D family protein [Deltaproteobacteria bacterium]|nr:monovalent cation/H+ antiporter subunit D family protein [Deltaproteobacteria bacterium]MBZ0219362.1 monovalent cation/H+ antiporter subunit D family protein [Deltaproteobacteria bacterium]